MIKQIDLIFPPFRRGFHLITTEVVETVGDLPEFGLLNIFIQHTSAGITINENIDPTVRRDFENSFNHLILENEPFYVHTYEGSDDMPAHIKSTLVGCSITIPITSRQLNLGQWQGIYLCEFRNQANERRLILTVYS